jgi:mono/diheme cytochrome c family protein
MRPSLTVTVAALVASLLPAVAQDAGDATRGRNVAQRLCISCHAIDADMARRPLPGVASFKTIANTPGMTALALSVWLRTPHRNMPNLVLEPRDRDDVIAYIVSQRER